MGHLVTRGHSFSEPADFIRFHGEEHAPTYYIMNLSWNPNIEGYVSGAAVPPSMKYRWAPTARAQNRARRTAVHAFPVARLRKSACQV